MHMRTEKRALDKLYKRRDRYEFPDWQREEVWPAAKKQKLIDTILRGWKLPKFYVLKLSEGPTEYEVVDGQQRMHSIFEFLDNELPLSAESAKAFNASHYESLPEKFSDAFDDFEIEVDEIEEASDVDIKEFFLRLQEGLPLTSSEKLNAVHSKLRNFCKDSTKHKLFSALALKNKRYAHFDVIAKAVAVEIEGLEAGLRYEDLKALFESQAEFSVKSAVAKRLSNALSFLHTSLDGTDIELRNRSIIQSLINLVTFLFLHGNIETRQKRFAEFVSSFTSELAHQVELGHDATDESYIEFQRTVNANVRSGTKRRHQILLQKLLQFDPSFGEDAAVDLVATAGIDAQIGKVGDHVRQAINEINSAYSSAQGNDFFKMTNKSAQALAALTKPVNDFATYKLFVEGLYFLIWEGPGSKLGDQKPATFVDINLLRTGLQHDVDHGKTSAVKKKKLSIGGTFKKYSGATNPEGASPSRFPIVQLTLLTNLRADLKALSISLGVPQPNAGKS